ncbi:hypothetical protein ACH4T9_12830 [Micromonospora sp. NPDC020750]|uniref:hypothetical protein n=1 Tax=unclassified Micromonospora TaxID=2617518 RepID=UPI00378E44FB
MSRLLVSNDLRTVFAEVAETDDGVITAACEAGDWATDPDRDDQLADVLQEAQIHMDRAHR